jgi:putative ABC transport system permease protein
MSDKYNSLTFSKSLQEREIMSDIWICAWRELRRRKARTAVSIIGYATAVAVAIVIGTMLSRSRQAADNILTSTGTHFIAFVPATNPSCPGCSIRRPESPEEGFTANGVVSAVFSTQLVYKVRAFPSVKDASPYLLFRFKSRQDGHTFTVGGFDVNNTSAVGTTCCAATDIIKGRFLDANDRGSAMLEESYARGQNLTAGDKILVANKQFNVVGVVNPGIRPAKADIYMPYPEALEVINVQLPYRPIIEEVNVILVEVASSKLQEEAMRSVRALLEGMVISSYACYRPAASVMGINERAAWILTWLLAAAVVLLAVKTEWSSVIERRREIGILKSMGWSNGNVIAQILAGSVVQALGGGLAGVVASIILIALLPAQKTAAGSSIYLVIIVPALIIAVLSGLVAGIIPAIGAARQRPADALRSL